VALVTSQKTPFFIVTAVKTSNLTKVREFVTVVPVERVSSSNAAHITASN
jgi:hypothetical protein